MKFHAMIYFIYCAAATTVWSEIIDLGVHGKVFSIKERNVIHVMQEKMASPFGQKLIRAFEERLTLTQNEKKFVPKPIAHLTPTPVLRGYLFNPSVSFAGDLLDQNGTPFYKAGTSVNPFDHMTLSKDYLFIDGTRPVQLAWARRYQAHKKAVIILVSGDPIQIMRDEKMQLFFDQEGAMATRFQLKHVPCSMTQEGKLLRITEWTEKEIAE